MQKREFISRENLFTKIISHGKTFHENNLCHEEVFHETIFPRKVFSRQMFPRKHFSWNLFVVGFSRGKLFVKILSPGWRSKRFRKNNHQTLFFLRPGGGRGLFKKIRSRLFFFKPRPRETKYFEKIIRVFYFFSEHAPCNSKK